MTISKKIIASMQAMALDAINNAGQGHIGMAIGAAPITYALIGEALVFSKSNSQWSNRDRFIMSAGHGSMAYYSIMHFMGLLSINDMKAHKSLGSKTPSHPEKEAFKYVDASTGPLGQGVAMGVGMAISHHYLKTYFNTSQYKIFDHQIFVLVGDGCLQEGVALEAVQLAGTMQLQDLIIIQDYNGMQIDSPTPNVNNTKMLAYFKSQKFHTIDVQVASARNIRQAIIAARQVQQPCFIRVHTRIAQNTPYENTPAGHNGVLTPDQTLRFKQKIHLHNTKPFVYDQDVYHYAHQLLDQKEKVYQKYRKMLVAYKQAFPNKYQQLNKLVTNQNQYNLLHVQFHERHVATRNYFIPLMAKIDEWYDVIGGSADLAAATKIRFRQSLRAGGHNIEYGVREHAMVAINNGIYLHSNLRTIDGTFLVFADYAKAAYRLGALMKVPAIHVLTHDSYQVGGDGPTHQPFEQLAMLRALANSRVVRPADETEMKYAFHDALNNKQQQTFIIGCRQPITSFNKIKKRARKLPPAYVIQAQPDFDVSILASGSEVELAVNAARALAKHNIKAQVVSVPILQDLVANQQLIHKLQLDHKPIFAIEASNDSTWFQLAQYSKFAALLAQGYGHSAPGQQVYELKGFNVPNVIKKVKKLMA